MASTQGQEPLVTTGGARRPLRAAGPGRRHLSRRCNRKRAGAIAVAKRAVAAAKRADKAPSLGELLPQDTPPRAGESEGLKRGDASAAAGKWSFSVEAANAEIPRIP